MQFPIKAHYATIAMLALAARYESGELLQARVIASEHGVPSQFLGQILQTLRTAGLIISTRGANGGFRLARAPEEISLAAIVESICCNSASEFMGQPEDQVSQVVSGVWREMQEAQLLFLEQLTLSDLVGRLATDPAAMFFI